MFQVLHVIRDTVPDGRLVRLVTLDHVARFEYLAGHINPLLVGDINELSRHVARSGLFTYEVDRLGAEGAFRAWLEPGNPDYMAPGQTLQIRLPRAHPEAPPSFEVWCRSDMIEPEVLREMNEVALPAVCSVLVPILP